MLLRFDRARSGRPVDSKTVSGRAQSGLFQVNFSGSRVFPNHVAHSRKEYQKYQDFVRVAGKAKAGKGRPEKSENGMEHLRRDSKNTWTKRGT